jgi:putative hydrolase of the HAD superfamily
MRQFLLIDADDTLWENVIHFEQAFDDFVDFLDHSTLSSPQVRAAFDEIELANHKVRGYGSKSFAQSLLECYHHLRERDIQPGDAERILSLGERIIAQPLEILPGVEETLAYLSQRHDLTLFTKGNSDEQRMKVDSSGLAPYFQHTEVVREKDANAYKHIVELRSMPPEQTWMVGNSPKSDINPALSAGFRAVYIPHQRTWHLEHEEVRDVEGRLLVLDRFTDLQKHF